MATHGLKRINIVHNPKYKRNGLKSYVYLLQKFNISPTMEGPFYCGNKVEHQGKFGSSKAFGGHTTVKHHVLMKRTHHHKPRGAGGAGSAPAPGSGTGSGSGSAPAPGSGTGSGSGSAPASGSGSAGGSGTGTAAGPGATPTTDQSGEVQATDVQNDSMYLCPVQIGTPAQTLMLDFDTGSADLWVWSTELPSSITSQYGAGHTSFDPAKSSTFKNQSGSTWKISYGDSSSASGTVGTDDVTLGGLTIHNQAIELANTLSAQFEQGTGDGLLGLAFGSINTVTPNRVQTPVENMISQSDIPKSAELFTAYLGSYKDANDPDKGQSFYTFGFIDPNVLSAAGVSASAIHYTPIDNSQGFWQFPSTSTTINGTAITQTGNTAIADTGTTLALVADNVVKAIYAAIPGSTYDSTQQGYLFPSSTTADQLPVVQFDVGGQLFTVMKEDLSFADAGNGMVYGGIQSRGSMTFDILGDTFLKSIYAIFDQGNNRFGAVQRSEPIQNLAPPPASGTS